MKTIKALVIDDDENSRLMAQYCLFQLNCDCDSVSGGEEALSFVSKRHYDLIFVDWNMPKMNGRETLLKTEDLVRQIGRHDKSHVIVYSGLPMSHLNIPQGYHVPVSGYISKHISPHKQLTAFKKYIDLVRKEFKEAS